ncbi:fructokinase [Flavobacterium sp. CF108]|uniref:carbohydrate kinase family protein n=1 Tax=unclassified Flavobacterium TaxID=196869 RepID=UPI0008B861E1|nr:MULTISPECIES: carbohydrate kinase [unclassified Flavobacterium]SEP05340.1 fructokinase [Flavobacterium sp. fv08]SHH96937.1 fructokinase [Flavobacterium sp. CF108]
MSKITCYGEVLWDVFPAHKKIGGAPLNVAIRLHSLGNEVSMISAIGTDNKGEKLLSYIKEFGIKTDLIQIKPDFKTGKVNVMLNEKGSASYDIMFPRAWDKITVSEKATRNVSESDAFVFGSLVARDYTSRDTLLSLISVANYSVFDVNLRKPYYTADLLVTLLKMADFIKFNDDELFEISRIMGSKYNSLEQNLQFIARNTKAKSICVTKGRHGAVLLHENKLFYNSGYEINVVDTVGAGDSFLASLISKLLNKADPQEAIDFACAVGALVAKSEGANPTLTIEKIQNFIEPE